MGGLGHSFHPKWEKTPLSFRFGACLPSCWISEPSVLLWTTSFLQTLNSPSPPCTERENIVNPISKCCFITQSEELWFPKQHTRKTAAAERALEFVQALKILEMLRALVSSVSPWMGQGPLDSAGYNLYTNSGVCGQRETWSISHPFGDRRGISHPKNI